MVTNEKIKILLETLPSNLKCPLIIFYVIVGMGRKTHMSYTVNTENIWQKSEIKKLKDNGKHYSIKISYLLQTRMPNYYTKDYDYYNQKYLYHNKYNKQVCWSNFILMHVKFKRLCISRKLLTRNRSMHGTSPWFLNSLDFFSETRGQIWIG